MLCPEPSSFRCAPAALPAGAFAAHRSSNRNRALAVALSPASVIGHDSIRRCRAAQASRKSPRGASPRVDGSCPAQTMAAVSIPFGSDVRAVLVIVAALWLLHRFVLVPRRDPLRRWIGVRRVMEDALLDLSCRQPKSSSLLMGNLREIFASEPGRIHLDWSRKYGGAVRYHGSSDDAPMGPSDRLQASSARHDSSSATRPPSRTSYSSTRTTTPNLPPSAGNSGASSAAASSSPRAMITVASAA